MSNKNKTAFTAQQIKNWRAYERVRTAGKFNMITQGSYAALVVDLSREAYLFVMENYDALKEAATEAE